MIIKKIIICFCSFFIPALISTVAANELQDPIVFCLDADNAPFSSRSDQATINTDIVHAIADKLQRTLQIQWVDVPIRGGLSRAVKQSLSSDVCDAFLGVPVEAGMAAELTAANVTIASPYLAIGYVAISLKESAKNIQKKSIDTLRFGASSATPADLFLLHNKLDRVAYGSNQKLLDALRLNKIDVALVWSPTLVSNLNEFVINQQLIKDLNYVDPLRWDISMAVKSQESQLLTKLNQAIEQLKVEGSLSKLTQAKGLVQL